MRTTSRLSALLGAVVIAASLAGCAIPGDAAEDAPSGGESLSEERQRTYYDNVVLLLEMADDVGAENSQGAGTPTIRGSWDEVDEAARNIQIEAGLEACAKLERGETEPSAGFLPWMAARFLCEDRLADAEKVVVAAFDDQVLEMLEFTVLKGDAPVQDVISAVEYCMATIEIFYTIQSETTVGIFCWLMRANVNAEQDNEDDFIFLFLHTEDEQEAADALFDEWATDMGATPNFLGELKDVVR